MEHVRLLLAILLSFLIFIIWQFFFVEKESERPPEKPKTADIQEKEKPAKKEETAAPIKSEIPKTTEDVKETVGKPSRDARSIRVNTPLYEAVISEKGAAFQSLILKEYRERTDKDSALLEMISPAANLGAVQMSFEKGSIKNLEQKEFSANEPNTTIDVQSGEKELVFSYRSKKGIIVEKKYAFSADTYLIDMTVTIINTSNTAFEDQLVLALPDSAEKEKNGYGFQGPSGLIDKNLEEVKIKKLEDKNRFSGNVKWIANQDRYFISIIIPAETDEATMRIILEENNMLLNQYVQEEQIFQPGERQFRYELYFGPKRISVLKDIGYELDRAVNFGWFDFLAKPCLWIMNTLYKLIPNYGVAIIILTILTKILLWPLGTKSYKSMNEMKKLQPLMTEIRAKYKDDKKKMNEELMGLYKTYKINPMGGCFPMIVQIPVFFALYRMIYGAIELRHAPFFGWINDLSAPDRLFNFNFTVPFMQPPYGIPVLTIIMGATMLLSQKMQPPAGDPAQAKMMMLMPVIFTVIFINFSSGLVLYWLVNNILSIGQQYYIQKKYA